MNRFSPIGRTSSVALVMRLPCPYTVEPAGAAHPYLTVWTPLKVLKVSMALLGEVFGSVICICVPICEVWKVGEMEQNKVGTNSRTLHVSSTRDRGERVRTWTFWVGHTTGHGQNCIQPCWSRDDQSSSPVQSLQLQGSRAGLSYPV